MPPDHRKQIDNLKKFGADFKVSVSFIVLLQAVVTVSASADTFLSSSVAV